MEQLTIWRSFLDAFNNACDDNDWQRLEPYLADDVEYRVVGVPFACRVRGKQSVIDGFAKSVAGFDSKFDERRHDIVGTRVYEPDLIVGEVWGSYHRAGIDPLYVNALGYWQFVGTKIDFMMDVWDVALVENQVALEWLAAHGDGLDASYV